MITLWKLANFKSIRDEKDLSFAPLTIFAGANSSGKSSFLQSILLIAQTLSNKVSSRSVVLNGTLTRLGQFDDLCSSGSDSKQIQIQFTCRPNQDGEQSSYRKQANRHRYLDRRSEILQEVTSKVTFDADPLNPEKELFQIQPHFVSCELFASLKDEDNAVSQSTLTVRRVSIGSAEYRKKEKWLNLQDDPNSIARSSIEYNIELDQVSKEELKWRWQTAEPIGCTLRHFLPETITLGINTLVEEAIDITSILTEIDTRRHPRIVSRRRAVDLPESICNLIVDVLEPTFAAHEIFSNKPLQLGFMPNDLIQTQSHFSMWLEWLNGLSREKRIEVAQLFQKYDRLINRVVEALKNDRLSKQVSEYSVTNTVLPSSLGEAVMYLDSYFSSSLKYLGPLRDDPKPLYPLAPAADPYDVGLRGEHTAAILELHKYKPIKYVPSANFKESNVNRIIQTQSLERAVIDWLQYLGVAESVISKDQGKLGHELKVSMPGSIQAYDLTHVGVGVSQILPILVMCLLAEPDTTIILEQPELHLHPKVQTLLGDFFLSMAFCSKQCIVETHSEYLINRLRYRTAAALEELPIENYIKIYFVEKNGGKSEFREVIMNEYGAIHDWPNGFFDQSQKEIEDILRAAMNKKRNQKKRGEV